MHIKSKNNQELSECQMRILNNLFKNEIETLEDVIIKNPVFQRKNIIINLKGNSKASSQTNEDIIHDDDYDPQNGIIKNDINIKKKYIYAFSLHYKNNYKFNIFIDYKNNQICIININYIIIYIFNDTELFFENKKNNSNVLQNSLKNLKDILIKILNNPILLGKIKLTYFNLYLKSSIDEYKNIDCNNKYNQLINLNKTLSDHILLYCKCILSLKIDNMFNVNIHCFKKKQKDFLSFIKISFNNFDMNKTIIFDIEKKVISCYLTTIYNFKLKILAARYLCFFDNEKLNDYIKYIILIKKPKKSCILKLNEIFNTET